MWWCNWRTRTSDYQVFAIPMISRSSGPSGSRGCLSQEGEWSLKSSSKWQLDGLRLMLRGLPLRSGWTSTLEGPPASIISSPPSSWYQLSESIWWCAYRSPSSAGSVCRVGRSGEEGRLQGWASDVGLPTRAIHTDLSIPSCRHSFNDTLQLLSQTLQYPMLFRPLMQPEWGTKTLFNKEKGQIEETIATEKAEKRNLLVHHTVQVVNKCRWKNPVRYLSNYPKQELWRLTHSTRIQRQWHNFADDCTRQKRRI